MFCAQCGAAATPGMGFCPRCGQTYAVPVTGEKPVTGDAIARVGAPMPLLTRGKIVAPWKVIVYALLTMGLYTYWMWWRTSREADEHLGARSGMLTRTGIAVALVSFAVATWAVVQVMVPLVEQILADPTVPIDNEAMVALIKENPLYLAAQIGLAVGLVTMYGGLWNAWRALRENETRRGRPDLVNPKIYAGLLVVSALFAVVALAIPQISFLSFALSIAAIWVTYDWQRRLNDAWRTPVSDAAPALGAW